jgi:hypothetical protein
MPCIQLYDHNSIKSSPLVIYGKFHIRTAKLLIKSLICRDHFRVTWPFQKVNMYIQEWSIQNWSIGWMYNLSQKLGQWQYWYLVGIRKNWNRLSYPIDQITRNTQTLLTFVGICKVYIVSLWFIGLFESPQIILRPLL